VQLKNGHFDLDLIFAPDGIETFEMLKTIRRNSSSESFRGWLPSRGRISAMSG
jgi:hypothetical protein